MSTDPLHGLGPPEQDSIDRGYETRDVRLRWIIGSFAVFVILFIACAIGIWEMLSSFQTRSMVNNAQNSVMKSADLPRGGVPLQPQQGHEMTDAQDLRAMHEHEDATFKQLGWQWNDKTHAFTVPAAVIEAVRTRKPTTIPSTRPAPEAKP